MTHDDLFGERPVIAPPGLRYEPRFLSNREAVALARSIAPLPFKEFEFHGFTGKRRVVSFGWKYDFSSRRLEKIGQLPQLLLPLRNAAALFADLDPEALEQVLVTEYQPGAAIGWHKDKAVFDEIVGVSLGAPCTMRFRRSNNGVGSGLTSGLTPALPISFRARRERSGSIPSRP
jgi:alkylated DNA repair dioxygenase AlkB